MIAPSRIAAGAAAVFFSGLALAQNGSSYTPVITYDSTNFFQSWDFFTGGDPTSGFVEYVDQATAEAAGLANIDSNGKIHMSADAVTVNPANGRQSVRLTSQQAFTHGLFLVDLDHMPGSDCGSWPAFWTVGGNWPYDGEIDIIEGVNSQTSDIITLHTSAGCQITNDNSAAGTTLSNGDCNAGTAFTGCGQVTSGGVNYGDGFNDGQGGVYAMEWTSDHIAVWFFPRSSIPADITGEAPVPSGWGQPLAQFNGGAGCNIDDHFTQHNIVFDITFCGSWAGQQSVWSADATCSALAGSCQDYVAQNPSAFSESYWTVNNVKVYQTGPTSGKRDFKGPRSPTSPKPSRASRATRTMKF